MKIRFDFAKQGLVRFVSHRDMMRILFRTIRRTELPVLFSQGFSPHYRVAFSEPLKVGISSAQEWCEMTLTDTVSLKTIKERFERCLPEGFSLHTVHEVKEGAPSLSRLIERIDYRLIPPLECEQYLEKICVICEDETMNYTRKSGKNCNLKAWLHSVTVQEEEGKKELLLSLQPVEGCFVSPSCYQDYFTSKFGCKDLWRIDRLKTVLKES